MEHAVPTRLRTERAQGGRWFGRGARSGSSSLLAHRSQLAPRALGQRRSSRLAAGLQPAAAAQLKALLLRADGHLPHSVSVPAQRTAGSSPASLPPSTSRRWRRKPVLAICRLWSSDALRPAFASRRARPGLAHARSPWGAGHRPRRLRLVVGGSRVLLSVREVNRPMQARTPPRSPTAGYLGVRVLLGALGEVGEAAL